MMAVCLHSYSANQTFGSVLFWGTSRIKPSTCKREIVITLIIRLTHHFSSTPVQGNLATLSLALYTTSSLDHRESITTAIVTLFIPPYEAAFIVPFCGGRTGGRRRLQVQRRCQRQRKLAISSWPSSPSPCHPNSEKQVYCWRGYHHSAGTL